MTRIIALAQRKGGVGKTTLAIALAGEIRRCSHDVAVVDMDPQCSAGEWAKPGNLPFTVYAVDLADLSVTDWAKTVLNFEGDYLVVDSAPNDQALAAAAALAHLVLLPCTPSGLDLEATAQALGIIKAVRQRRIDPLPAILVPNRVNSRSLEGRELIHELATFDEIVASPVGNHSAFVRTFASGHVVGETSPTSGAAREVRALWALAERTLNAQPHSAAL